MKDVSEEYKILSKNIRQQHIKLSVLGDNELSVAEVNVMPVNIFNAISLKRLKEIKQVIAKEVIYGFDGQLFKTIMKQIDITVKNANEIKDKDINFKYGLLVNNKYEYVDLGSYFIKDIEDDKKQESITVTGYDKMIRFMKPFKQSELKLTYPCKLSQLVQKMGEVCGVEIYSLDFYNADLLVDDDFFTIQELTYRDVLEKITQATLTTAFIKDDKLYFGKIENTAVQKLDKSYISNLIVMEKFGPLNAFVIGRGEVEDNLESTDDKSILENGRCEIRFDENELIQYSNRKDVIDNMLEEIKGLEYYSFEGSDLGVMWLEPCDVIELGDRENNFYKSIYLSAHITLNTGIKCNINADIPEETNTKYKVTTKEEKKHLKVERLAKKNEGLIQDVIEEQTEHENKISQMLQTIDSFTQKVENEIDVTREVAGIKEIELENCIQGQVLEFEIYGNNTVFDYLLPSNDLLPSDDLLPYGDSEIEIIRQVKDEEGNISEESEIIDLGITERLRQKEDVKDRYRLKDNKAQVIRKIGVFEDGTTYVLPKEKIEELGELKISLNEGTNKIRIVNYTANLKARYVIKNEFSTTFASYVQVSSLIRQTTQEILMQLSQKVGDEEIIAKFNMAIKDGQSIVELIGDIVRIKSKYFELTADGQITALKGIIAGLTMSTNNNGDSWLYKNYKIGNKDYQSGLFIPNQTNGNSTFLYAGCQSGENTAYSNVFLQHNGNLYFRSGYLAMIYEPTLDNNGNYTWYNAMVFNDNGTWRYLSNGYQWMYDGISYINGGEYGHLIALHSCQAYEIRDAVHNQSLIKAIRLNDPATVPSSIWFYGDVYIDQNREGTGYRVLTSGNWASITGLSDKKYKTNIKKTKVEALPLINKIKHKSFKWKKEAKKAYNKQGDVENGYIANELEKIFKDWVNVNSDNTRSINVLNMLATATKAIQELSDKNNILEKKINKLENSLKEVNKNGRR